MVSQKKQSQVKALIETLQKNSPFVLIKFDKTSHQTFETLRHHLKKQQATLKVIKNTLFEKAINKLSSTNKLFSEFKKKFFPLKENSAIVTFQNDWSSGLNAFYQFIQKEKTLNFKFGLLDQHIYDEIAVLNIAKLPSKDQLIAKIIGSFKSPMSRFTYSLKFNLNKFVYILKQRSTRG